MGKDIELAILFADVVGSTRIYEVMGDLRARDMVLTCVEIMRTATEQNHGTVIKTIGDEIMATFPTANDALNAASRMQHDIRIHAELKVEGQPIAIRIGGHFGPVVLENRDIFGAAVHTANRMTSQAKAGQVMVTSAIVERLTPEWKSAVRQIDVATLKGKTNEDELYEVLWQKEDATSMLPSIAINAAVAREKHRTRRLRLRFQGGEIVLDEAPHERHDRPRRGKRHRHQGQPHFKAACPARTQPEQDSPDRPEHERHVRDDPRRRGSVRPSRQHAAERRGLDRFRPRAGAGLAADSQIRLRGVSEREGRAGRDVVRASDPRPFVLTSLASPCTYRSTPQAKPLRRRPLFFAKPGGNAAAKLIQVLADRIDFLSPGAGVDRQQRVQCLGSHVETLGIEVGPAGDEADRSFDRAGLAVAAVGDPAQDPQVLPEARAT